MRFRYQLAVGIGAQIALTTVSIVLAVVLLRTMVVDLRDATHNITATARVVHDLRADAESNVLRRALGALNLTTLGIGSIHSTSRP